MKVQQRVATDGTGGTPFLFVFLLFFGQITVENQFVAVIIAPVQIRVDIPLVQIRDRDILYFIIIHAVNHVGMEIIRQRVACLRARCFFRAFVFLDRR